MRMSVTMTAMTAIHKTKTCLWVIAILERPPTGNFNPECAKKESYAKFKKTCFVQSIKYKIIQVLKGKQGRSR